MRLHKFLSTWVTTKPTYAKNPALFDLFLLGDNSVTYGAVAEHPCLAPPNFSRGVPPWVSHSLRILHLWNLWT